MSKSGISAAQHSKAHFLNDMRRAPVALLVVLLAFGGVPGNIARGDAPPVAKSVAAAGASASAAQRTGQSAAAELGHFRGQAETPLDPTHLFLDAGEYVPGGQSVATGDFNGDRKADLVVATGNGTGSVAVLLGNGDGTFQTAVDYATSDITYWVAVGDFNGDGKLDIVAVCAGLNSVNVLLGNGDGTFQTHKDYATGISAVSVTVADLNGDGKLDLVAAIPNQNGGTLSVLLGNGDGSFKHHVEYAVGLSVGLPVVGDFNGDGKPDLVTTDDQAGTVYVLLGNGDGTFQAAKNFFVANSDVSAVAGDFDGDGKLDLAVVDLCIDIGICTTDQGAVYILLGNGDGTFQPPVRYLTGRYSAFAVVTDLNGDGHADLAVMNVFDNSISVLLGKGDGTFQAHADYGTGALPSDLIVGDFNGDGRADLAVSCLGDIGVQFTVSILLGNGNGSLQTRVEYGSGTGSFFVAVSDLNGDGKLDLAVTHPVDGSDGTVRVLLGNGDGTFQAHADYTVGVLPDSVAVGDFNGDGKPDLAVVNFCGSTPRFCFGAAGSVSILLGNGDGTFQPHVDYFIGDFPEAVAIGDFNGDGKLDLAVVNCGSDPNCLSPGVVSIFLGNGDGSFRPLVDYPTGVNPFSVAVGDFSHDGKLDLAVANYGSNTVSVLPGKGDGTFGPHVDYVTGTVSNSNPRSIAVWDLNGDGNLDLAVANQIGSTVSVLLGKGDGTFQSHVDYLTPGLPVAVAVGDFNGDGKVDLAVTAAPGGGGVDPGGDTVSVLLGNGDGTFQGNFAYATGDPGSVAVGDFNGDGKPDLAVADGSEGILLNTSGTRVKLTSAPNPSKVHQSVVFTATVKATVRGPSKPAGTVTFLTGTQVLGTATLANGLASLTTAKLTVGSHKITAQYSGDSTFSPNTSRAIIQKVTP